MRRRQLAAIIARVLAGARSQPIVLAFEDLQWADPTSIDVLRALSERGAQARLFIVATGRGRTFALRGACARITAPLDRGEVRA